MKERIRYINIPGAWRYSNISVGRIGINAPCHTIGLRSGMIDNLHRQREKE